MHVVFKEVRVTLEARSVDLSFLESKDRATLSTLTPRVKFMRSKNATFRSRQNKGATMYGPRSCEWATDEEYLRIAVAAVRDGHIPPPRRRQPPRPSHLPLNPTPSYYLALYRGDFREVPPPIPRRPAPHPQLLIQ